MLSQWIPLVLVGVLVSTILFVMIPVQKATTVHTTITSNIDVQRILFNDINLDACTGPGAPSTPCIAADTIELIPSGTFWKGEVCINNDNAVVIDGLQIFVDGAFKTHANTNVLANELFCFSSGGNGLRVTDTNAPTPTDIDVAVAFDKEG